MIKNYFTVAVRQLFRNRTYSFINILGLGLGLATGFIMLLWVQTEYSMNRYHQKADRIYEVAQTIHWGNEDDVWEQTPAPLAAVLKGAAAVENVTRFKVNHDQQAVAVGETNFVTNQYGYAENSLFGIFDFPVIQGSPQQPFAPGLSVVLTESTAKRFFGAANPLGKSLRFRDTACFVSAVIKDLPLTSSFQFDLLFSLDLVRAKFRGNGEWKTIDTDWGNASFLTFALLKEGAATTGLSSVLLTALKKNNPQSTASDYPFRALKTIYLYKPDGSKGRVVLAEIFFIVALFVLLIAAINYVNLVTARATQRIREIGIRKVIGAEKQQLFVQFFTETGVLLLLAAVVAMVLVSIFLPVYEREAASQLAVGVYDWQMWRLLFFLGAGIWLVTGAYPAFLLAALRTVPSLKGGGGLRRGLLRKSLVVLQFVVSMTLLLGTVFIHRQMAYVQSRNLNLLTDNIVTVPVWRLKNSAAFVAEISSLRGVQAATTSSSLLFEGTNSSGDIDWEGKPKEAELIMNSFDVDRNFLAFFGTKMLEGTDFRNTADGAPAYVLNETAVRKMGLQKAVGKKISWHNRPGIVIGVVKDFHFESLHREVGPALLKLDPENVAAVYVRVPPAQTAGFLAAAQRLWKGYENRLPMEYRFLDETIAMAYDKENRAKKLFDAFAFVTLLISCMGLFGLATHSAERRVKEIGIRKVLGAGIGNLTALLSKEFLLLLLLAVAVAVPVAYTGMSQLLQHFAYRISLQWWVFVLTCTTAVTLAMLTVMTQAVRAARANPVKNLRSE